MSQNPPPPDTLPEESLMILPHDTDSIAAASSLNPRRAPGNSGCRSCLLVLSGCGVILIVAFIALLIIVPSSIVGLFNGITRALNVSAPAPVANIASTQTIVIGIQPLGQLVSVSSQLAVADVEVNVSQGALNACAFGANHVVQGTFNAGVDLTQITEEDLLYDEARGVYILTVPPPQLTSCSIDYIRQYERSFTTCSVDWDEARLIAQYVSLVQLRDDAVEGGLLRTAESNTRLVLGNFVRLITGREVEIVFEAEVDPLATAEPAPLPPNCAPEFPAGWSINPNGEWTRGQ